MICDNCASFIEEGMRFCSACGVSTSVPALHPLPVPGWRNTTDGGQAPRPVAPPGSQPGKAVVDVPVSPSHSDSYTAMPGSVAAGAFGKRTGAIISGAAAALIAAALAGLLIWKPWLKPLAIESIEANKSRVQTGESVSLKAHISGPDPDQLSYAWKTSSGNIVGNGPEVSLDTSGSNSNPVNISLIVNDQSGRSASAQQVIYITASASPAAALPQPVPGQQPSPGAGQISASTGPAVSGTSPPGGTNSPVVRNMPPSVRLTARSTQITQGEDVELIADASDKNGGRLSFAWNTSSGARTGDGSCITLKTASIQPGPVEVRVTVSNEGGMSATDSLIINVVPRPTPAPAIARLDADRTRVAVGEKVTLKVYPEPNNDLTYRWTASAGSINYSGATAVLDTSGLSDVVQITVTATVRDSQGRTAAASKYVAVTKPPPQVARRIEPVSASAYTQGDDLVVNVSGSPSNTGASSGAIEVTVMLGGATRVFGHLPEGNCHWNLVAGENAKPKSLSFKELPGPFNRFSKLSVRLRPNNDRQPVHFTITWRLI